MIEFQNRQCPTKINEAIDAKSKKQVINTENVFSVKKKKVIIAINKD
jgi:hypothetical protein